VSLGRVWLGFANSESSVESNNEFVRPEDFAMTNLAGCLLGPEKVTQKVCMDTSIYVLFRRDGSGCQMSSVSDFQVQTPRITSADESMTT
jgi:hypothetical protein